MKKLIHTPTENIPPLPDFPYRVYCRSCRNTIAACEHPIPKKLRKLMENTPCSKCVPFKDYMKELERE